MAKRAGRESLAVDVADQLRAAIYGRELAPGERLRTMELSSEFDVSSGVIREALNILISQDLVRQERNKGFHVIPLSWEYLNDLIVARTVNEGTALRLSVEQGGAQWESEVVAAYHRLIRVPAVLGESTNTYNSEWGRVHAAFHHRLLEACGNSVLLDICDRLSSAAEVYRAWAVPREGHVYRQHLREHEALRDACLAHDPDLAVSLLEQHLRGTLDNVEREHLLVEQPEVPTV